MRWDITNQCNLRCAHCFAVSTSNGIIESVRDLNFLEVIQVIRRLKSSGLQEINFAGREPTMHHDILRIIRWCRDNNITINITTNGTFFNSSKYAELIRLGVKMIIFSLDGPTRKIHDQLRGEGNFEKTLQNIIDCNNLIDAYNYKTRLGISCTLHKLNVDVVPDMIDLATTLGIKFLSINPISFLGAAMPREKIFYLTPEEISDCFSDICSRYRHVKSNFELFLGTFPMESKFLNAKYDLDLPVILTGCSAGKTMYIDHNGNALPCYMLPAMSSKIPRLKRYLNYWQILSEPEYTAVESFKPFISFTQSYSQDGYKGCQVCPDLEVCKPCPLIAISEPETIHRCQQAGKKLSSVTPQIDDTVVPQVKSYIKWIIEDSVLRIDITRGDYFCKKEFELNNTAKSIWLLIDGRKSYNEIMELLQKEYPRFSERELHSDLKALLRYFYIEGVVTFNR